MVECATSLEHIGFAFALQWAWCVEIAADCHILPKWGERTVTRQDKASSRQAKQRFAAVQRIVGVKRQNSLRSKRLAPCAVDFKPFGAGKQRADISDIAIV